MTVETEMAVTRITPGHLDAIVDIFLDVYNGPPWNDSWERENARAYLAAFMANPHFIGYALELDNCCQGACFGKVRYWWQGTEYYISEIFVARPVQRQGRGAAFMEMIQADLTQKGIHTITLLTDRQSGADRFYDRQGFRTKERVVMKYKNF